MSIESASNTAPILPEELNLASRPAWNPLTGDQFPAGSFGRAYFLPELKGRKRPSTTFQLPLDVLFKYHKPKALAELSAARVLTCADALNQPSTMIEKDEEVTTTLERFLDSLTVTPQGKLLAKAYRRAAVPVSLDAEDAFVATVNTAVNTLFLPEHHRQPPHTTNPPRKLQVDSGLISWLVLVRRFGLIDGIPHTLQEIGQMPEFGGVRPTRVAQLEARALRVLLKNGITNLQLHDLLENVQRIGLDYL